MNNMKFSTLRAANLARIPLFKNAKGEAYHREDDGSDWSLNDWYTAVMGEAGELGNDLKKVRRGDYTLDEKRAKIGKEIADVITPGLFPDPSCSSIFSASPIAADISS